MAKTNIGQFDTTANNNTDVDNTSLAEGWSPALVNNAIRALMALLAEAWDDLQGYTATGTDTYAVTTSTTYTAYAETGALVVTFTNANTGAATLNVDTIGAAAIKKNGGTALSSGDIAAGTTHILIHDGTDFEIIGTFNDRASLGLDTSDSPQFAGIELGHATANTLTASGGKLSIESDEVLTVASTTTSSGAQTMTNKTLTTPAISSPVMTGTIQEDVYDFGATPGATFVIDPANGSVQTVTLNINAIPTETLAAGDAVTLMIDEGAATYTCTFTHVDQWAGGSAPTLPSTGSYAVVELWKVGAICYGAYVGDMS